jgi:hypothetical protein
MAKIMERATPVPSSFEESTANMIVGNLECLLPMDCETVSPADDMKVPRS